MTIPINCIKINRGTDDGLIPAKLFESIRPIDTAGLAKLVDEVK